MLLCADAAAASADLAGGMLAGPGPDLNRRCKLDTPLLYGPDLVRNFCPAEPRNCTSESRWPAQSQIVAQLRSYGPSRVFGNTGRRVVAIRQASVV